MMHFAQVEKTIIEMGYSPVWSLCKTIIEGKPNFRFRVIGSTIDEGVADSVELAISSHLSKLPKKVDTKPTDD